MEMMQRELIIQNYIRSKRNYCYKEVLLNFEEIERLKYICEGKSNKDTDDFFNLITDEIMELRNLCTESYVYTYKQAQALIFCCKYLGLDIDVTVEIDYSKIGLFENNITKEYIQKEIDMLPIEYIEIKRIK